MSHRRIINSYIPHLKALSEDEYKNNNKNLVGNLFIKMSELKKKCLFSCFFLHSGNWQQCGCIPSIDFRRYHTILYVTVECMVLETFQATSTRNVLRHWHGDCYVHQWNFHKMDQRWYLNTLSKYSNYSFERIFLLSIQIVVNRYNTTRLGSSSVFVTLCVLLNDRTTNNSMDDDR